VLHYTNIPIIFVDIWTITLIWAREEFCEWKKGWQIAVHVSLLNFVSLREKIRTWEGTFP
jgi:low affinity Fe/Cu permease